MKYIFIMFIKAMRSILIILNYQYWDFEATSLPSLLNSYEFGMKIFDFIAKNHKNGHIISVRIFEKLASPNT